MPNHITNIVTPSGDEKRIKEMLESIKNDEYRIGTIDFNKIIRMPESLNIEAGSATNRGLKLYTDFVNEYMSFNNGKADVFNIPQEKEDVFLAVKKDIDKTSWELGKTAFMNIQLYGSATWYEWSIKNRGTKWNAYGYEQGTDYSQCQDLRFNTAWSAPHPVIKKLSEMYSDIEFKHKWADEDIGMNCGSKTYKSGTVCEEYIPDYGTESIEFAASVLECTLENYGYVMNKTETGYISAWADEYELIEVCGVKALFDNGRISDSEYPKDMYKYEMRMSDDDEIFCTIENSVAVNFGGTVLTKEPIDLGEKGYVSFTPETSPNFIGVHCTMQDFLNDNIEKGEVMDLC